MLFCCSVNVDGVTVVLEPYITCMEFLHSEVVRAKKLVFDCCHALASYLIVGDPSTLYAVIKLFALRDGG